MDWRRDSKYLSLLWPLVTPTLNPASWEPHQWLDLNQMNHDILCCASWEMKPQHGTVSDLGWEKATVGICIALQFLLMLSTQYSRTTRTTYMKMHSVGSSLPPEDCVLERQWVFCLYWPLWVLRIKYGLSPLVSCSLSSLSAFKASALSSPVWLCKTI